MGRSAPRNWSTSPPGDRPLTQQALSIRDGPSNQRDCARRAPSQTRDAETESDERRSLDKPPTQRGKGSPGIAGGPPPSLRDAAKGRQAPSGTYRRSAQTEESG